MWEKLTPETIPHKDKDKRGKEEDEFQDGGNEGDALLFQLGHRPLASLLQHRLNLKDAWGLLQEKLLRLLC